MKRSLSFSKKFLVAFSAVVLVLLYIVIDAVYSGVRLAPLDPGFYFIMAVSFGFVFLLAMLVQLASSLRQPESPKETWIVLAKFFALQRKSQLAGLVALVILETLLATVMFWDCVPPPLRFEATQYGETGDPFAVEKYTAEVVESIKHAYPLRLVSPEWAIFNRWILPTRWSKAEATARSSLIFVLWLLVVGSQIYFYVRKIAVTDAADFVSAKPTP